MEMNKQQKVEMITETANPLLNDLSLAQANELKGGLITLCAEEGTSRMLYADKVYMVTEVGEEYLVSIDTVSESYMLDIKELSTVVTVIINDILGKEMDK